MDDERRECAKLGVAPVAGISLLLAAGNHNFIQQSVLACVKDAYKPLNNFMNSVAWHNWITHGIADVILFVALGLIFSKSGWTQRIASARLASFLVGATIVAGVGLFVWYARCSDNSPLRPT